MRKIKLILLFTVLSIPAFAQYGSNITAKDNGDTTNKPIRRFEDKLKVWDSSTHSILMINRSADSTQLDQIAGGTSYLPNVYSDLEIMWPDLQELKDSVKYTTWMGGSTQSSADRGVGLMAYVNSGGSYTNGTRNFLTMNSVGRLLTDVTGTVSIFGTVPVSLDSSTQKTTFKISTMPAISLGATATYDSTWSVVQMDTAGLGAMPNSATVGWQSDSVGLRQWKCTDVKIGLKISMANTAPANDKAVYVYVYPIWYDGSTWYFTSQGTTTLPTGANATTTIAAPNNLRLLGVLSYTTQNMVLQDQFMLSNAFGQTMPDAFGIILIDYSGAALHTTNHRIYYSLINKTQR
jgi:hypothetical protein